MAKNRLGSVALVGLVGFVALATNAGGCGDDGNNLAQFTGTWSYTASMATLSCPGDTNPFQFTLGPSKQWGEGLSSALVDLSPALLDPSTSCYYGFDVKDKVLTIQAGQTCTITDINGSPHPEVPTAWTFTLLSASTAEEQLTAAIDSVCTVTGTGTLKKVAKN